MADKPSYKQVQAERKGSGSMEIEGVIDTTKPKTFTDKTLEPPRKPGENPATISPADKATPGQKAEHAITHPGDWTTKHSDIVKT